MPLEALLTTFVIIGGFTAWVIYSLQQLRAIEAFRNRLRAESPLYLTSSFECRCTITTLGGDNKTWRRCMLEVTPDGINLYPSVRDIEQHISIPVNGLRWFGRPVKYHDKRNEIWLHLEQGGAWQLVRLSLWSHPMKEMIRALKQIVPPELITAYRRNRPYIHEGPVTARPAEQDIYGAWSLNEALSLYVMPLYVVLLSGDKVQRLLPLERIQQIAALRRLDAPNADGLVSLTLDGEKLAFAVRPYERLAAAISEAAKRSLEEPVMQKQKKKDDEDEWEA